MSDLEHLKRLRHHVEAALEYSGGTHNFDDVAEMVGDHRLQLWPASNSVVLTEIIVYPRLKNLHYFLAGGDLDELSRMRPMIESDIVAKRPCICCRRFCTKIVRSCVLCGASPASGAWGDAALSAMMLR